MNGLPQQAEAVIGQITDENAKKSEPIILSWKGTKTPRGLSINGVQIAWAKNGIVTGVNGEMLGTYARTKEFAGPNRDEHAMIVIPRPAK
jgi:hypothetical protein